MNEDMYRLNLAPGRFLAKSIALIRALGHRLWILRHWRRYDALYLQRELFPIGPPILERWLKRRGAVMLFDYDDALFIKKASRFNPVATFFRSPEKTRAMFRIVDCTIAGNNWLRDVAISAGGCAKTVEVAENTARFVPRMPDAANKQLTVGWLGSPSTVKYLNLIAAPLRQIASRHPDVRWEIMGGGEYHMEGVPWELHDWSLDGEAEALARYDIGLMPLPDEIWALGKSGGKARTYMAAGVVPVVSAIGYNLELVDDGRTGFLCRDEEDWITALESLLGDASMRNRIAEQARSAVEMRFASSGQARKLADLIRRTVEAAARPA